MIHITKIGDDPVEVEEQPVFKQKETPNSGGYTLYNDMHNKKLSMDIVKCDWKTGNPVTLLQNGCPSLSQDGFLIEYLPRAHDPHGMGVFWQLPQAQEGRYKAKCQNVRNTLTAICKNPPTQILASIIPRFCF